MNGWTRFVSMQNHDNLIYREEEREMLPLCRDQGVGVPPWSPLARGRLAGNRTGLPGRRSRRARRPTASSTFLYTGDPDLRHRPPPRWRRSGGSRRLQGPGVAPGQAWRDGPIVGATKFEHLEDAVAAEALSLSDDELRRLEDLYVPHPVSGIEFKKGG